MSAALLAIDVRTLVQVLCLGNFTSVAVVLAYYFTGPSVHDGKLARWYILAKACQAIAYFLLLYRELIPDVLSVNLGNTLLMAGFYFETLSLLSIAGEDAKNFRQAGIITAICIVGFNLVELWHPDSSVRVAVASVCIFTILVVPNYMMLTRPGLSYFKRAVAVFYTLLLVMLLPRAVYALLNPMHILSNSPVQALTFLTMVLLLIFSLSAYMLLMKESVDLMYRRMATTDYLTGLNNRHHFFEQAERMFMRHRVNGESLAIVFFDIDHFKKINDSFGHSFGDTVLSKLGRLVYGCVRPTDLACRYGGEEFVVLLSSVGLNEANMIAERLRSTMAQTSFPEQEGFAFSISVGIVCGVPDEKDTLVQYIANADAALYSAKHNGRNRVTHYRPEMQCCLAM